MTSSGYLPRSLGLPPLGAGLLPAAQRFTSSLNSSRTFGSCFSSSTGSTRPVVGVGEGEGRELLAVPSSRTPPPLAQPLTASSAVHVATAANRTMRRRTHPPSGPPYDRIRKCPAPARRAAGRAP